MASQYYNTDLNSSRVNVRMPEYDTSGLLKAGQAIGDSMNFWKDRDLEAYKFKKDQELLERDRARFGREQELNKRVDTEYNREIGLRDMRKDLAAQYEANPYADIWGGGAANKGLDKQVTDYVNAGGEITPDMAGRLQSEYEKNRPFKEDLSQVFRSKLLAAGEDPTKADAYAKSMTDNMPFSRATQQAQLDKQQEVTQKWYDAQANANLEALKLNMDANKVNANNATDILKSRISSGFGGASVGGGSKGTAPGGYANLTADELSLSWMPAFTKMGDEASTQEIINGLQAKSVPSGIAQKALEESVVTKGADRYVDKNLLKTNVDRYMGVYGQTAAGGASATTVDAGVNPKQLLAQFAPRQIAGYDPQGVLERAKTVVPELFGKEVSNSLPSNGVGKDVPSSEIKKLVVDKYGDSNFNKSTYDKNLSEVESGGNYNAYNATSKAFGKYQFVPSTINSLIKQDGSKHTIDEVRKSPELQDYYYDKLTKENIGTLKSSGVPINNFTVYMAHNLGPSQTENFFSNEPLTEATKKAIQAQGVVPTREAYTSRFMHKFENTATPEEKRPTVQKEDISRMTDAERKAYADKVFPELATEGPIKELFSKVNTDVAKNTSKYGINEELIKRQGGVGGQDPDRKIAAQRTAEIDSILGPNPAPTPENMALMDEKLKLNPRTVGDKVSGYANTLRRELLDPLGPSGYAVGGMPKVGSTLSTGLSKLDDLLRPNKPLLLENLRPQGGANWTGTGRVATDKLNGVNADTVLGQAGNKGNKLVGALRNADEAKGLLDEIKPTNLATPEYFSNLKTKIDTVNMLKNKADTKTFWDDVVQSRVEGKLSDEQVAVIMRKLNSSGLINTRELLESLDKVGVKR